MLDLIHYLMHHPNVYVLIHILSAGYSFWRLILRARRATWDGVIGATPSLDIFMCLLLGPVLAFVDIVVTIYGKVKNFFIRNFI
jgi:hypothetical protein